MTKHYLKIVFVVSLIVLLGSLVALSCAPAIPSPPAAPQPSPATAPPSPAPSPPEVTKKIIIKKSATAMPQIGQFDIADPGYTFLVVNLEIENRGYDSFSTNPFFFSVVVSNVKYSTTFTMLDNQLKAVDLLNGGKVVGKLAFEVPEDVPSVGYQIIYQAFKKYNIEWIE